MNLLVGLVLIVCLFLSELSQPTPVENLFPALIALFLVSVSIPGLAFFQAWFVMRRQSLQDSDDEDIDKTLSRMSACHSAVWLVASLMIVSTLRWPDIVRANWNLDYWPVLDEIMLVLPIVLSLFASWLIHASLHKSPRGTPNTRILSRLRKCFFVRESWSTAGFQLRYLAALFLLPLALVALLNDLNGSTFGSWARAGMLVTTVAIVTLYPIALLWLWPTRAIDDEKLGARIKAFCRQERLGVFDVRVLNTNGKFLNAVVIGLIPNTRIILLTDALIERFSQPELMAIVRHEAAHIQLHHFAKRLVWILAPMGIILGFGCVSGWFSHPQAGAGSIDFGGFATELGVLIFAGYLGYLWFFIRPKAIEMEFEADSKACQIGGRTDQEAVRNLTDALLRMAVYSPTHYESDSLGHPSFAKRIESIVNQVDAGSVSLDFQTAHA